MLIESRVRVGPTGYGLLLFRVESAALMEITNGRYSHSALAEVEVRTPFAQVVESSREHSVGYSPMQAGQDYKQDPDTLQVRIQIRFTTFGAPFFPVPTCQGVQRMNSPKDCFHDFEFRFSQSKDIQPIRSYGVPI